MSASDSELLALAARWRKRAQTFRHEAKESDSVRDIYRLAGMASSLDYAARELSHTAGLDPRDGPTVDKVEADQAILEMDIRLARDVEESEP